MKKLLAILLFFFTLSLLSLLIPENSYAQCSSPNGCFDCVAIGDPALCQAYTGTNTCASGYDVDPGVCSPYYGNTSQCNLQVNNPCIIVTCGNIDEPCCPTGQVCNNPSWICNPNTNRCCNQATDPTGCSPIENPCGNIDQPCCPSGQPCNNPWWSCDSSTNTCVSESQIPRQPPNTQPVFCNESTNPNVGSIDTAIGCISVKDNKAFAEDLLGFLMGIAGGLGFLLIVYSGFLIMTSSGDPKKLAAGKETLTAAIAGLLLLVLGTYLLRVIGVDILGIF